MNLGAWDPETLWLALEPLAPGLSVEVLPEVGSTNTALLERARAGDTQPALLAAERQSAGRGRLGRTWLAQPGQSLTFSLGLLLVPATPADWGGLSLAVGLALAEALDPSGAHVGLKWPNDLWLRGDDRKLAGILIETLMPPVGAPEGARWVVTGVGINVLPPVADGQGDFRTGYACVHEWQPEATAPAVLHQVAPALLRAVQVYARDGLAPLRERYAARDVLAGRQVQATGPTGALQGEVDGVDADGALRLCDAAGRVHAIHSGEVSVRPC